MKEKTINSYAAAFAAKVKSRVETYGDLRIVCYNYGSSPSLAYWQGPQVIPTHLHFLRPESRDNKIRQLRKEQDRESAYRLWTVSTTYPHLNLAFGNE